MNKYALSIFFVILAIQGFNAGFLGSLFSIFGSVLGFVFGIVIRVPLVLVSFSDVFVVTISNVVFTTFSALNNGALNAIVSINSTAGNASAIASIYATIAAGRSNRAAKFMALIAYGNVKDVLTEISYTSSALASISAGCAPPSSQPFTMWGTEYPEIYACFNSSSTDCNSTSISCQASAYVNLSSFQMENIKLADEYLQQLASLCSDNSTIQNMTNAEELIELWGNLSSCASGYISDNGTGPLLTYTNCSFDENLSSALNQTAEYLSEYSNATGTLLNCSGNKSFKVKGSKARKNFGKMMKRLNKRSRRWKFNRALIATNTFYVSVSQTLSALVSVSNDFMSSVNGIIQYSFIYSYAKSHGLAFGNMAKKFKVSLLLQALNINFTSSSVEQNKTNIINNASDIINATSSAILIQMEADNSSECSNYTADVIQAIADYSLNVEACGEAADNATEAALVNATNTFRNAMQNASALMNGTNDCYKNGCAGASQYPFSSHGVKCANDPSMNATCWKWKGLLLVPYNCPSSYANSINNCLGNITASINATIAAIDAAITAANNVYNAAVTTIISTLQTCVQTQVNATLAILEDILTNYTECINSTSTNSTNSTSTTNSTGTTNSTSTTNSTAT